MFESKKKAGKNLAEKLVNKAMGKGSDVEAGPKMKKYKNTGGGSNVMSFCHDKVSITIKFMDGETYLYDAKKPGAAHVAQMINLAEAGQGLYAYITRFVKKNHAAKVK